LTGGIFREDQKDGSAELAFKYAVYRLNRERTILPNTTLVYDIQYVPRDDSFRTSKKGNNNNNNNKQPSDNHNNNPLATTLIHSSPSSPSTTEKIKNK
jgi:hypothetical protein